VPAGDRSVLPSQRDRADRAVPRLAAVGSCPICNTPDSDVFFRSPDMLYGVPGEFTYRRCASCRTVFQDPRVIAEDIPLCYPDGYYTHATGGMVVGTRSDEQTPGRRLGLLRDWVRKAIVGALQQHRHDTWQAGAGAVLAGMRGLRERAFFGLLDELIPRQAGTARALDVGCGAGHLMAALGRAGWAVEGLELDPVAAEVARRTSGYRVTVGDLLTGDLPASVFDLVVLSHVFEHLDDPNAALRRIAGLLAPTGRAVLIYPNPGGLGARLFRELWAGWEPPRHLVIPSAQAMAATARRNGLLPLKVRSASRPFGGFSWRVACNAQLVPGSVRAGWPNKLLQTISKDRFLKEVSVLLRCLGFDVGEEIVVALAKGGC
jgi:SAM-dependent methyltransferase